MTWQGRSWNGLAHWMVGRGPDSDIVMSSRIRLARNLKKVPYPHKATAEQLGEVLDKVKSAGAAMETAEPAMRPKVLDLENLLAAERQLLVEEHLTSPQHIQDPRARAVVLSGGNAASIMVNEEDHIRVQSILPGLQMEEALRLAFTIDDGLEQTIDYAFDEELGYLCACPTNIGTGLRASVMLHLPALAAVNMLGQMLGAVAKVGVTVRGIYGEGTESVGNLFQVSNQVTIGRSEQEIVSHLEAVTRQIVEGERNARGAIMSDVKAQLEDRVYRSYGILTNARMISSEEALRLMSDVRLGADLGIIPGVQPSVTTSLSVEIMPAHVQEFVGKELTPWERDSFRATLIRERLSAGKEEQ